MFPINTRHIRRQGTEQRTQIFISNSETDATGLLFNGYLAANHLLVQVL